MSAVAPDWQRGTLDDLVTHETKGVDPRDVDGLPYVGLEHIDTGEISLARSGDPTTVRSRKTLFETGDILYGKLRPYLDKAVLAVGAGICSTDILVLRPKGGIDPYFAGALLHLKPFVAHAVATTVGVNHPRTSWNAIRTYEVLVPPLSEQRAIAHVLRTVHRAKEATEQVIAAAQELKKSLLQHLYSHGLVEQARVDPSDLIVTSAGAIPRHWRAVSVADLGVVGNGSTPKRSKSEYWEGGTIPWITSAKVHEGVIERADEYVTELAKEQCHLPLVPSGSVVVAISGQGKTLGNAALVGLDTAINQHLAYIRLDEDLVDARFLVGYLSRQYADLQAAGRAGGSTRAALTCGFLAQYPIPVPPLEEQRGIARILDGIRTKTAAEEARRDALSVLFDSLLHDLMTARLRVSDLKVSA